MPLGTLCNLDMLDSTDTPTLHGTSPKRAETFVGHVGGAILSFRYMLFDHSTVTVITDMSC
jgi:hypothetical protein